MNIIQQIEKDYIEALKNKETERVGTFRLLKSALSNAKIAKGKELEEADEIQVLNKEIKSRMDSVDQYKAGNRPELVEQEEAEIKIIQKYLPEQMSDEELEKTITEIIAESGAIGMKDMGKVMGLVIAKTKGMADNSKISQLVRENLS
jgi:hypothetical protein